MNRMTAHDFDQGLLTLFDKYVHGIIDRRKFLDDAAKYAVGGMTATMLLEQLAPNYALAAQVMEDDSRVQTETIEYDSPDGNGMIKAYKARPAGASGPLPGVVVVHENRGLNPYVADVARRLAVDGFVALAPDGLTPLGGYPGNDEDGRAMQQKIDGAKLMEDFMAAFDHLKASAETTDRIGVVGFCYGGGVCNTMAVRKPDLAASVPFYGRQPDAADVPKIQAALQIHYAGLDERVNAGWPAFEAALKANGKEYAAYVYPDVNHGFHNDTTPRYDEAAATLAWDRTIAFFKEKLA